jgi:hypothetical protein
MMRYLMIVTTALMLSGCVSTDYLHLATQASARMSSVNSGLGNISESSRLAGQDRAHYTALLEESARKLQIEADREFAIRKALDIKAYKTLVDTLLTEADTDRSELAKLGARREQREQDIEAEYQALVVHARELSAAAKGLADLGTEPDAADRLKFLVNFAMDVSKAYADASKNANGAKTASSKETAQKTTVTTAATKLLVLESGGNGVVDRSVSPEPAAALAPARGRLPSAPSLKSPDGPCKASMSVGCKIAVDVWHRQPGVAPAAPSVATDLSLFDSTIASDKPRAGIPLR